MASGLTLTTLRTRVQDVLMDASAAVWANNQIDAGIRRALEEYSKAGTVEGSAIRGRMLIATLTPASGAREVSLSTLTTLVELKRVWFPYDASAGELPNWIAFDAFWDDTTPKMLMRNAMGDGSSVARLFYWAAHTLNGLDSATATTFDAKDDNLLIVGACGHACAMRSVDLNETAANMAVSTPNYAALADRWLKEFRAEMKPRRVVGVGSRQLYRYYDANLLEWVTR